jgi:putative intracellular protease/amidase
MTGRLRIAVPLFPRFTALDAIGPYEVLAQIPAFDIAFVGHAKGEVRADNGMLGLVIDGRFEDLPSPDVIVFPGGDTRPLQSDARVLDW